MSLGFASIGQSTVADIVADAAVARRVTRLSSEYVLRLLQLTIDAFGDLRAGLLAQAINAANTAHFNTRSEGWGRHAIGSALSFPNEVRRPISISALAASTGLPFETTRRVVQRLIDSDVCARVEGGVIVLMETDQRPSIARAVIANVGYVRRFMRDLQAMGFVANVALCASEAEDAVSDSFVARVLARLGAVYLLRALRLQIEAYGDIREGILVQTVILANTSHLDTPGGEGLLYADVAQAPPPVEVLRPITIARLAESLGLPFETVRRHMTRLMQAGVCVRIEGGLIVPPSVLNRPEAVRNALANVGYVRKFAKDVFAATSDAQA